MRETFIKVFVQFSLFLLSLGLFEHYAYVNQTYINPKSYLFILLALTNLLWILLNVRNINEEI